MKRMVRVNENGKRIGQYHPNAKLTDEQIEQLIIDRGPVDAPSMTLSELGRKWGLSKSGVKGILDGRNRGQLGWWVEMDL